MQPYAVECLSIAQLGIVHPDNYERRKHFFQPVVLEGEQFVISGKLFAPDESTSSELHEPRVQAFGYRKRQSAAAPRPPALLVEGSEGDQIAQQLVDHGVDQRRREIDGPGDVGLQLWRLASLARAVARTLP